MSASIKAIQSALLAAGFDPKGIDGSFGANTRAAVTAFQRSRGLKPDGIVGKNTLAALMPAATSIEPPWMSEARRRVGLHEVSNYSILSKWLRSDGRTLGDPRKLPWCGDFISTCIALTLPDEPQPTNPYLARNWLKFGRAVSPVPGAIGVFWRGSRKGTSGHVGIIAEVRPGFLRVIGGNQSNAVTDDALLTSERLLGARWPDSFPFAPPANVKSSAGLLSTNEV